MRDDRVSLAPNGNVDRPALRRRDAVPSPAEESWQAPVLPLSADAEGASSSAPRIAEVRVATELYGDELQQLAHTLERHFGGRLELRVTLDPRIIGGVWVRVGDTVLDGSLRGHIETLRHHLHAQTRAMLTSEPPAAELEAKPQ